MRNIILLIAISFVLFSCYCDKETLFSSDSSYSESYTTTSSDVSTLPQAITDHVTTNYAGQTINSADLISGYRGSYYKVVLSDETTIFIDSEGHLIDEDDLYHKEGKGRHGKGRYGKGKHGKGDTHCYDDDSDDDDNDDTVREN